MECAGGEGWFFVFVFFSPLKQLFLTKEHSEGKTVTNFRMVKNISHKQRICCQNNP